MPLPLTRLFPKIKTVSNDASLILSANAVAIFHRPTADLPTRRAPTRVPILAEHSFKFVLQTNHSNLPISLLVDHLKQLLDSRATSLGISSVEVVQDDIVLVTTDESNSSLPSSPLPYAVLDHIVLDYRFRIPNLTELYDGSQSQEPLLPLKELLDPALQRLVCIHFIRQLPLVFGCWNDVLEDEAFLSKRIGRAIRRIVARSKDPIFKRHLQQSTGNMCRNLNKLCDHLLEQLVDNDEALAEEDPQPNNVESIISRSLLVTSQAHFRPKPLKRKANVHSFDERDMPEEPQTTIHDQVSEQDAEILPELDAISPLESEQNPFQDDSEYSSALYDEFHETGPHIRQLDGGSIQSLDSNNLRGVEDKDLYQPKTSFITAYFNEDESDEKNLLRFEDEDPDQVSGLEEHSTDDNMIFD